MSWMCLVKIVSFTMLNTTLMFFVSVAVVKWRYSSWVRSCLTELNIWTRNFWTSPRSWGFPYRHNSQWWLLLKRRSNCEILLLPNDLQTTPNIPLSCIQLSLSLSPSLSLSLFLSPFSFSLFLFLSLSPSFSLSLSFSCTHIHTTHYSKRRAN